MRRSHLNPRPIRGLSAHQQSEQPIQTAEPRNGGPEIVDLTQLPPQACPCGTARRAFAGRDEIPGTIHLTEITRDAVEHYHKEHTEVYVILECEDDASISLDGIRFAIHPHTSILIPPGVRHCAHGEMKVLIYCTPNFDPNDEYFDP
jgi:mannose-6-phosphate isomerase-like protein (cupin superfamily)